MEEILIRNLPAGTKAALRARAKRHYRSIEAEARAALIHSLAHEALSIVDLVSTDEAADIEFEPDRLSARTAGL